MFTKVLFKNTKEILAILGKSKTIKKSYLAGGTAAALYLGHRISVDLDFFTPEDFNPRLVAKEISNIGRFELEQASKKTVLGRFKKSLVYFVDAERDEAPKMLKKVDWNKIKKFFKEEVVQLKI